MRLVPLLFILGVADCGGSSGTAADAAVANGDLAANDLATNVVGDLARSSENDMTIAPSGPGIWVAVGYGGRRMRSLDGGMTWVDDQSLEMNGGDDNDLLRSVVWGDGKFVALGYHVLTSPDGKTWTDLGNMLLTNWVGSSIYAQNKFVIVGGYGLRETSTDATAWTSHSVDTQAAHDHDGLAYGDGHFVMATDNGARSYSTDGVTWTYSTGATAAANTDLAYGNGVFVAVTGTAVAKSSDGGATFSTAATLGTAAQGVVFAQGHFTTLGNGHVYTSTDGTTWTDHAVAGIGGGNLVYGNGTYLLFGWESVRRSTDGITWASMSTGSQNSLEYAVWGNP